MRQENNAKAELVYRGYTQDALDRAYTQASWAPNMKTLLENWQARGTDCRTAAYGYSEHAYGSTPCERLDVFHVPGGRFVHFHIHGGAWQRQAKEDCSFIAPGMQALSVPFVVPEFGRLPDVRMPTVLAQIARALQWTHDRYVLAGDAEGIVLSGHSSGAHMAALLASQDLGAALPASALRAVLCISGAYDLDPVMLSLRSSYIDLNESEITEMSPIHQIARLRVPLHLVYGEKESPEFIRQSKAFAEALAQAGKLGSCTEVGGANHFEVADQLVSSTTPVGALLKSLLARPEEQAELAGLDAPGARLQAHEETKVSSRGVP